ncbi:unnamed protein product [Closterium sp. NIES-53]
MDTSSKGAKTYTARLGERILWDLHEDRDVYNEMWQIPVVPMPKERQVAASISTKGEAVGSGDGANGRAKEMKSKKCNLGGTSKLGENHESGAAAKKQHKGEENPKAAVEEEYGENMWGTIASAAFSNPTSATGECDWLTLHRRMGHVALPILQQLVKNEMVAGIRVKGEPDEVLGCPTCMQAMFTRYTFSSSEATAKAPLDEVVMDVVAPLKLGAAGAEYFLTIVDVYTRMTWVYVLSKKSDVAETVKTDWLPMVERQQDRLTARGLLIEAGLPDYFWPDAVRSACVAKNRALTHVGAEKWVPYVEWIGRKPKVDVLRVFGCMCMALVPKHLWHNKLGAKAIWAVHLGMAQNCKGWFIWDPFTKKFLVSRDCKFMENLMYKNWKAQNEAKIGMRFGEVKSSGLEHVELPLELSSSSTTTRQSSLVNGGDEAKDAEEEEEEVQQVSEHAPTLPSRTTSAPRIRVTPQQRQGLHSSLAGAALMVGDDEESDYEECAFTFFFPVEMPGEPATLKEALESSDDEKWKKAMESELKSIEENGTWELVELPEGRKAITSKWLFKIKSDVDGKIERYKSRLVAKGYQQKEKVDYKELFSPVVKPTTLRTLLAGAAIKGWVVKQMDVTTAFLSGVLEEEIFMAQPERFDDGSGRVLRLKKALYGLKQAPRQWYLKLRGVLEEIGFTPSTADHSLFMLGEGEQRSFMVVYVDDILIFSPSSDLVKEVMLKLQDKFKSGVAIFDIDFDVIISAMYALFFSAEGDCYWCAPPGPGIAAAALGASASGTPPGTASAEALHTFTLDSGASRWSSLYTLATEPPQTLLWHHRLGHPSLPLLRGMHSRLLVSGLPRSLPPLPSSPAPPCLPCAEGRQRTAPHSSSFSRRLLHCRPSTWMTFLFCVCTLTEVRRIGLVMEVARTSLIHAAAPNFLEPFAVQYAEHQLNLRPRVSLSETLPTLRWTGKVGDASVFRFYHPTSHRVLPSQDVTFDESVPFYRLFPYRSAPSPPPPLFLAPGPPPVDPLPLQGPAPPGVSQVDPLPSTAPVQVAVVSGAAPGAASGGAVSGGAEPGGARSEGVESGGAEPEGVEHGGAESEGGELEGAESDGAESGGAEPRGTASSGGLVGASPRLFLQQLREWLVQRTHRWSGAPGAGEPRGAGAGGAAVTTGVGDPTNPGAAGAGGAGAGVAGVGGPGAGGAGGAGAEAVDPGAGGAGGTVRPRPYFVPLLKQPASPLPVPSPYIAQSEGLTERREPASRPVLPVRTARRAPRSRPPPVPDTYTMALYPSSVALPAPPESSLPAVPDPESDRLLDFAAACRLEYASALIAESVPASPPSVGGECALGTDVLEDRQEDFECLAAAAITGPYSSQWKAAMDAEMASWKSTGTYVDEVPPPGVNIVDGMWIFRVKRPPGSPPAFKARYVARGFSQRQGVDYFHTLFPTPKMTTLRVLLHVAAERDYELHSLDFSTAFLQGSLHEEIWLRRPPGFTGSFPTGSQWSLRQPVYGLRQAPREWHDTLRTTLAALGFVPSTADPSLFLRTDTSMPPFYVLVYVEDLVFATADTEALTLVNSELQKRHTCTDLGELRSYLGLQITRDRARRTITLTQSHMVHQVLQRFGFQYSSPQLTPLSTSHSLSAPPSDESIEPSGPYPELVGCLMYLMTCTRPDLAYPLSLLARYVAPGRHRKVHCDAAKRVLRYLCSTSVMGLVLGGRGLVVLTGHADASWVDDSATQRSSQGYTFSLGSGSISWRSTRSSSVLNSSCEAEIYAGAMAAQELCWLAYLLTDLGEQPRSPPVLYLRGQLRLAYVATRANTADVFTKALPPGDHYRFVTVLGLTAMDTEMASWKSTGTYVDVVPPSGANIIDGMWIFRVKRLPDSPPVFKARYVARGFNQRQGADFFHTFSPTPKIATLRVLVHVAAQRDYLGLQVTRDRAQHTITLTQSHMVHQVLQRFGFRYSLPQSTPLPTGHSLLAPPSDESLEPSGPYPELVGCLIPPSDCQRRSGSAKDCAAPHQARSPWRTLTTGRASAKRAMLHEGGHPCEER